MTISKIEFCDAKEEVFNPSLPNIVLTLSGNDVLAVQYPKDQLIGLSHLQYQVNPWSITVRYDTIYDLLDQWHTPIPMDRHRILNKYMCFISTDDGKIYSAFILFDTADYSLMTNEFTFEAVNMNGVISKYNSVKPIDIGLDGSETVIPRNIKYDLQTQNFLRSIPEYAYVFGGFDYPYSIHAYVPTPVLAFGTIVINIFSNNNENRQYDYFWQNHDAYDKWWVSSITGQYRHIFPYQYPYISYIPNIEYLVEALPDTTFNKWKQIVYEYCGLNESEHIIEYPQHRHYEVYATGSIISWGYGERNGIAFRPSNNGYYVGYEQLKDLLISYGYFAYQSGSTFKLQPFELTSSVEPTTYPENGQWVIGLTQEMPDWLDDLQQIGQTNPYMFRRPENDNIKRDIYLDFYVWGYKRTPNSSILYGQVKSKYRRFSYKIDPGNVSGFSVFTDTGWVERTEDSVYFQQFLDNYPSKFTYYDQLQYHTDTGNLFEYQYDSFLSLDYGCTQDKMLLEFGRTITTDIGGSLVINREYDKVVVRNNQPILNSYVYITAPPVIDNIHVEDSLQDVTAIEMLYSILLIKFKTMYPADNVTYDGSIDLLPKYLTNDFDNITTYYEINNDLVETYAYIPIIASKPESVFKYNMFRPDTVNERKSKYFYLKIIDNYTVKVVITLIGNDHDIDMNTNRFFVFNGKKYMVTSIQMLDYGMIIQGYGGVTVNTGGTTQTTYTMAFDVIEDDSSSTPVTCQASCAFADMNFSGFQAGDFITQLDSLDVYMYQGSDSWIRQPVLIAGNQYNATGTIGIKTITYTV